MHQARKVMGHLFALYGSSHRSDDQVGRLAPAHVPQHHLARQDRRTRVHIVFARVFWLRTMRGLKHSNRIGQVPTRRDTRATHVCSKRIRDVVAG